MARFNSVTWAILVSVCLGLGACSEDPDQELKNNAQAELEAWAEKREAFAKEHCQDKTVSCSKLMREAGLDKPGKVNY